MQSGPCSVCGGVNYPLSCGGPAICPHCDTGAPKETSPYASTTALEMAQSTCMAWQHVFEGIEAHLLDRIAMQDAGAPHTYLDIIRHDVARVREESRAIVNARWADSARYQERIAALEERIFDMLLRDDGQAWSEARSYLRDFRPDLAERLKVL